MGDYTLSFNGGYFFEKSTPGKFGTSLAVLSQIDFIDNPNYALNSTRTRIDHVAGELRLTSPAQDRFRFTIGLFYEELETASEGVSEGRNVCLTICSLDVLGAYRVNTTITPVDNSNTTTDRAILGSLSYDISDNVTVSLEGRYQQEKIESSNGVTNFQIDGTWNAFLPRLNLQFKATDDMQFYVIYSRGNNPGAFNTSQFLGAPGTGTSLSQRQVDEETLDNYELGIKSMWLDNRLMVNAAFYHQIWEDMQYPLVYFAPGGGQTFSVVENRGSAQIDGLQIESLWMPIEGLDLRATFAYNDGRYGDSCSANYAVMLGRSDLPPPNNCLFVNGKKLENVPRQTRSLSVSYTRPMVGDWKWFARTSYQYASGMWSEEWNVSSSSSATVFTGNLGIENGPFSAELYCRNCDDELSPGRNGRTSDLRAGPTNVTNQTIGYILRPPRTYGIRLNYNF